MSDINNKLILGSAMQYLPEIITFVLGGFAGSLLTLRLTKKTASGGGTVVDQTNANAGRDITGGNKHL